MNEILVGNCFEIMPTLEGGSFDLCVTSPPYWGLRDYGIPATDWPEVTFAPMPGLPTMTVPAETSVHGLEKNIWAYVAHEVLVFREVRRIMADHAVLFLNLGDSYNSVAGNYRGLKQGMKKEDAKITLGGGIAALHKAHQYIAERKTTEGLKPKDLCGIPERVSLALQADGWWLRSRCPWLKKNSMPESCTDRPASSLEYVFILAKSADYFWDMEGVKRPCSESTHMRISQDLANQVESYRGNGGNKTNGPMKAVIAGSTRKMAESGSGIKANDSFEGACCLKVTTRNLRNSDWFFDSWQGLLLDGDGGPLAFVVNPQGSSDAHFATFPPKLVEPMILAACPREVCTVCGKPTKRITKVGNVTATGGKSQHYFDARMDGRELKQTDHTMQAHERQTLGWTDCGCGQRFRPGRVLDCFGGSGTVGAVAANLKRDWLLIELNPTYVHDIASFKLQEAEVGLPAEEAKAGQLSLFGEAKP